MPSAAEVNHQAWKAESALEADFLRQLENAGLPLPTREYLFAPPRRFRFDAAWPERRVAVELDGGAFVGGRHTRGTGFDADCEKTNLAAVMGWTVLRFTTTAVRNGDALRFTTAALRLRSPFREPA